MENKITLSLFLKFRASTPIGRDFVADIHV